MILAALARGPPIPTRWHMPEPVIDDDKMYKIRVTRPVKYGPDTLRPNMAKIVVSGKALKEIQADVLDYEELQ